MFLFADNSGTIVITVHNDKQDIVFKIHFKSVYRIFFGINRRIRCNNTSSFKYVTRKFIEFCHILTSFLIIFNLFNIKKIIPFCLLFIFVMVKYSKYSYVSIYYHNSHYSTIYRTRQLLSVHFTELCNLCINFSGGLLCFLTNY